MKGYFSEVQEQQIVAAIVEAEKQTSGEIRLHVVSKCDTDPKSQAIEVFEEMGMTQTKDRNGVLIFLAVEDKKFAIIGDTGINEAVPHNFWDSVRDHMADAFKKGDFVAGIVNGVKASGEKLQQFFPYDADDQNELTNDISFGK